MDSCNSCELTFHEVLLLAANSEDMIDFFIKHNIIKSSMRCPECNSVCQLKRKTLTFRCKRKYRHSFKNTSRWKTGSFFISATKNTFLARHQISFEKILNIIAYLLFKAAPRQKLIMKSLNVTSGTVVVWFSFTREVYARYVQDNSTKLGGIDQVVEIYEAKIDRRKSKGDSTIEGEWIFGGIQRDSVKMFVVPVEDRTKDTLLQVIRDWILPGTTIISDCWKAYNCLQDEGYQHLSVSHSLHFVGPTLGGGRNIRRSTIPKCGTRGYHMAGYLSEYLFKYSIPNCADRMHLFFETAAKLYPPL